MAEEPKAPEKAAQNDYKDTVNLPKTDFPMKASLPQREPQVLERWQAGKTYERLIEKNEGKPLFVFHDGPPYANGHIHQGHILNKVLKDIVVKYANMSGRLSEFIPGWDCHGLPIELKSEEELGGRKMGLTKLELRKACRAYAQRFVDIQREEFKRLGVFARWEEPYLTMSFDYEANIVRELARFAERGALVRGKKPVYWCIKDRTALAEAEVEYEDHKSPSIYVAFPVVGELPGDSFKGKKAELVIWTTTPWTLPANLAISAHPDFTYVVYDLGGRRLVVAKDLLASFLTECAPGELAIKDVALANTSADAKASPEAPVASLASPGRILGYLQGKDLEGVKYRHVLNGRTCPVILGEHVTAESGTGLVHTAPGHGADDYNVGRKYGLETLSPVDAAGHFTDEAGEFAGQGIFDANPKIVQKLVDLKALLSDPKAQISHSYPCCWRCKKPVIFRATAQWFIPMEVNDLRKKALAEVDKVRWIPKWGRDRIFGMLETRPDWCVSRQRAWGVPIPVFYCEGQNCDEALVDPKIMEKVAQAFEKEGADAWYAHGPEAFLPAGTKCKKCGGEKFRKEEDILDVWFDSGVSWAAVAGVRKHLRLPVDLYLEGSDQHRGWFHSSLLTSVGTRDTAPYKTVLTHGFVVDGEGKKMSKNLGNYVPFDKVIKDQGAEIARLWVASSDYREDIRASKEILDKLAEGYRKIRNTLRYALGNVADFNPETDAVKVEEMLPIDRWALARLNQFVTKVRKAYDDYEFHVVYHAALEFCAVDLSAVYFDILKDRLYTTGKKSQARRSAQTVVHEVLVALLQLLAPITSFTCEEAWGYLPHKKVDSVFLSGLPEPKARPDDERILAEFAKLLSVRSEVQKVLEAARRDKLIGSSLEAKVVLSAEGELAAFLAAQQAELPALFIASKVELAAKAPEGAVKAETLGLSVKVERAPGTKCPRCWNYSEAIDAAHAVCSKCAEALKG
ncbi:MAG TPA: isoleucine--tRNA ligase [Myxococcales bacterium]